MSAASRRSRSTLALLLLAAVVSISLALAPTATARDGGSNAAQAINEKDGSSLFDVAFEVRRVSSGVVDQTNSAVAYSSCESCQTVAIAFQIVLVSGSPDTVTPTNLAVALNEECTTCQTIALAYQFVFGTGEPLEFTKEGRDRLKEIRKGLKALGEEGLTPDEIRAGAQQLADEVSLLLSTGLVPKQSGDDEPEGEDDLDRHGDAPVEGEDEQVEDDLEEEPAPPEDEYVPPEEEEVEPEEEEPEEDEPAPEPVEPTPAPTEPAPEEDPTAPAEP